MSEKEYIEKELVMDTIDELKLRTLPKTLLFDHLKKVIEVFPTESIAPVKYATNLAPHFDETICTNCGVHLGEAREILFHGKRTDDDEGGWVEGYYASQSNYSCTNRKNIHFILRDECRDIGMGGLEYYEIDPETVGQYIGQTDKNGTKIFEWDIVKCTDDTGIENIFIIMWDSRRAMFYLASPTFTTDFYYYSANELEVIGNIHDNPELFWRADNE